jgi:hypothetical protein
VPILYTQDLPVEVIAQPTATPSGTADPTAIVGQPNSIRNLLMMGILAAGLAGVAYAFMRSQEEGADSPRPKQSDDSDPFGHI